METLLWITHDDGTVTGPHGIPFLRRELIEGNLTLDHLAAQTGTEDWLPLQEWGGELYPKEAPRRGPYAQKVSAHIEPKKGMTTLGAIGVLASFCSLIYFGVFYEIAVSTEYGRVANLSRMNDRMIGIIGSFAGIFLAVFVDYTKRKND